ncbi:MAG: ribonuclease HII [Defluviitaleaceae bacterium]|nr:ribonuclease HII [Defluviitaleaceae bacterium]
MENFLQHEQQLILEGFAPVAGVDEVGRGPFAGPVLACALILPEGLIIDGVNDSKKISPAKRERLAVQIKAAATAYAFGIIDVPTIERVNILQATMLAMAQAVENLPTKPGAVLIDGTHAPAISCKAVCLPQGDSRSHLIAAASILAKVERDNLMANLHETYPQYGFEKHKGYGTPAHIAAIREHGLCPQHRASFCRKFAQQ